MVGAREATGERLITDVGGGRFSFAHALVRDTLYEEVSPPQRSQLHQKTALALEELYGDDPARLGELAHHFLAAASRGDAGKAIEYAERAGEQAMDQLAYEEATELYERALEVARARGRARRATAAPSCCWRWAAPRRGRPRSPTRARRSGARPSRRARSVTRTG